MCGALNIRKMRVPRSRQDDRPNYHRFVRWKQLSDRSLRAVSSNLATLLPKYCLHATTGRTLHCSVIFSRDGNSIGRRIENSLGNSVYQLANTYIPLLCYQYLNHCREYRATTSKLGRDATFNRKP